ncbi:hypothetical protein P9E34_14040 [Schinkia azotoformans]|uniref:hypothetical protein n=1 Tax=Schinkia azotoformans TaxID=1454 RepID=UPI002DB615BD|nr:hypothetical protein [Schinkia azotoformans]MEC1725836.1 hypothetical protein [Schinkia azotoformans]
MGVKKVYVGYYSENGINTWEVTDNEQLIKQLDPECKLATITDLHDWVAATGEVFEEIVESADGLVQWFSETTTDELGMEDCICEYRNVA